jgi:hypothetical protein
MAAFTLATRQFSLRLANLSEYPDEKVRYTAHPGYTLAESAECPTFILSGSILAT